MSNYTKATNFAAKDALPVGDANKKVKGVEIDNEFNAISNAVSTKADSNSPTFTGTPAAPTAASGTATTQLATTAFVDAFVAGTANIENDAVTTAKILDANVTEGKIASGAVTESKIGSGAVTSSKIASSVALAGSPTTTTQTVSDRSTKIATTDFVRDAIDNYVDPNTGGASTGSITVTYGPSGKVTVIGSGGRNAAFANFGNMNFYLNKNGTAVRSATLITGEYDNRKSSASATLMYTATGTPGATESWSITTSGAGSQAYVNIAYIGF